jgi:hypothetical protein
MSTMAGLPSHSIDDDEFEEGVPLFFVSKHNLRKRRGLVNISVQGMVDCCRVVDNLWAENDVGAGGSWQSSEVDKEVCISTNPCRSQIA